MLVVYHPVFGKGVVVDDRFAKTQLRVKFDLGITLWVDSSSVRVLRLHVPTEVKATPKRGVDLRARRLIEAFRLGIVPYYGVEEFTFGRDTEIEVIKRNLTEFNHKGGGMLLIEGEYGAGKTHMMDYIALYGLKNNFAVSRVELDPLDVAPYRPRNVYRELIRSLTYVKDGKTYGFNELMQLATNIELPKPHLYISKLLNLLRKGEDDALIWDWIWGEPIPREYLNYRHRWRLPVILDHRPAVDVILYLLTGFSYIIRQLGSYGWVLLIDEGETLFHTYSQMSEKFGYALYRGLVHVACGDRRLVDCKLKAGRFVDTGIGKVDEHGFLHSGVRPLPYIYEVPTYMFLVISVTPSSSVYYEKVTELFPTSKRIRLTPLSKRDYLKMFDKIIELYSAAYGVTYSYGQIEKVKHRTISEGKRGLRQFLKSTIDELDILRHYGDT